MIARFSAYGFLKNQRYFEPFLALLLIDRGVGFAVLGALLGVRQVTRVLTEIPTGVVADVRGRRSVMVASMLCYLGAFATFALGASTWHFAVAMIGMGLGDALRTGTHKAMILQWLRLQGREDERTQVYGYTRSWSKLGNAVGVVVGTAIVLAGGQYEPALWLAFVPYVLNTVNLATYPAELDIGGEKGHAPRAYLEAALDTLRGLRTRADQRRVMAESLGFAAVYGPVEDYLQPMLFAVALAVPVATGVDDVRRSAVLIGLVYVALYLLAAWASRNAHRVTRAVGSDEAGARSIWLAMLALFALLSVCFALELQALGLVAMVAALLAHDVWRPIVVSRLDAVCDEETEATLFSIESQARGIARSAAAPAIGFALDVANAGVTASEWTFWPVAVFGLVVALIAVGAGAFAKRNQLVA